MKKFQKLLIDCIGHEITGTTIEKLVIVKRIFESEMCGNGLKPSPRRIEDWLRGLCSTVSIPFTDFDIVTWHEKELGRKVKNDNEYRKWVDRYWMQCGKTLYSMLYN
jgi:hypothetical protein